MGSMFGLSQAETLFGTATPGNAGGAFVYLLSRCESGWTQKH